MSEQTEPYALIDLLAMAASGEDQLSFETDFDYEQLPTTRPVHVTATISRNNTGGKIRGHYAANVEEPCDRCSEPFDRHVDEDFEESFMFHAMANAEFTQDSAKGKKRQKEIELQSDDFYDVLTQDECLDVKALIYQLIVLATSVDRFCNRDTCQFELEKAD